MIRRSTFILAMTIIILAIVVMVTTNKARKNTTKGQNFIKTNVRFEFIGDQLRYKKIENYKFQMKNVDSEDTSTHSMVKSDLGKVFVELNQFPIGTYIAYLIKSKNAEPIRLIVDEAPTFKVFRAKVHHVRLP